MLLSFDSFYDVDNVQVNPEQNVVLLSEFKIHTVVCQLLIKILLSQLDIEAPSALQSLEAA